MKIRYSVTHRSYGVVVVGVVRHFQFGARIDEFVRLNEPISVALRTKPLTRFGVVN
jgi:hypothetical protein